jgi:hypothetical protein
MFKHIRVGILLLILVIVAGNAWLTGLRTTDWDISLEAVIYPINGDGSAATAAYIASLEIDDFEPVGSFMASEGQRYQLGLLTPITIELAPEVETLPPAAPFNGGMLSIMAWSLKMRWWAWWADTYDGPGNIRIFVLYYDPATHKELDHSLGLKEGLICMVNAFADYRHAPGNNVIIGHELLHTLGATDKYDPQTGMPVFSDGYADPQRQPLHPQRKAEIMGGLIPVSADEGKMPSRLSRTVIGPLSAAEVGWTAPVAE